VPEVSVVILNYNGASWIRRCLESLEVQTLFARLEVIVADNGSQDGSDDMAQEKVGVWANGRVVRHGANLGFCEGNNRAALEARGRFLFFLNNDTWLEPDCLQVLLQAVKREGADAGTPLMLNYEDDAVQSAGAAGFDVFGWMSFAVPQARVGEIFVVGGCCYLIRRELFERLGGFDARFYLYAEEYDLSWRLWLAGGRAVVVPGARLHHRTAAVEAVGSGVGRVRTSDSRRYYTNRNGLWVVWKNAQHALLLLLPLQVAFLVLEAMVGWALVRRWSFVRRAYLEAVVDCWRGREHVRGERRRIRMLRRRSDWWMLRFLRLRWNRWDGLVFLRRHGMPKVTKG
jgi:GT2 family glycosyltransferase